jgi:hypothetical protein
MTNADAAAPAAGAASEYTEGEGGSADEQALAFGYKQGGSCGRYYSVYSVLWYKSANTDAAEADVAVVPGTQVPFGAFKAPEVAFAPAFQVLKLLAVLVQKYKYSRSSWLRLSLPHSGAASGISRRFGGASAHAAATALIVSLMQTRLPLETI